jgi:hypothetical protein|tara:strand:- start:329 stop:547 length:219 start_codon:yes stop_codon:yes gene_type:complete
MYTKDLEYRMDNHKRFGNKLFDGNFTKEEETFFDYIYGQYIDHAELHKWAIKNLSGETYYRMQLYAQINWEG